MKTEAQKRRRREKSHRERRARRAEARAELIMDADPDGAYMLLKVAAAIREKRLTAFLREAKMQAELERHKASLNTSQGTIHV